MTVRELAAAFDLEPLAMPQPDREVNGGYVGDLLSWVMGRAEADQLWITIMNNVNTVAVASLSDVSAVLLAEGVRLDPALLETAAEKEINVLSSAASAFDLAARIGPVL